MLPAALLLVLALSGCAQRELGGRPIGGSDLPAPRVQRVTSGGATIALARPAYVALVEVGAAGARLVYAGGDASRPVRAGIHRIRLEGGNRLSLRPPAPSTVRTAKVCQDEPGEYRTGVGAQACAHRQVGTPGEVRAGFNHLVVFASEAPIEPSLMRGALRDAAAADGPEGAARALASAGGGARWAAYVSDPY